MHTLQRMVFWLGLLLLPCGPMPAWAGGSADIEYQIKAAYLYKFTTYIEWPPAAFAQADTPLTIGIVGADEIAAELNRIKSAQPAGSRPLEVKILRPGDSLAGVQILFIGRQENARLKRLLEGIQSQPVLTVTESAGGLAVGGIINFVPIDDRIRFEVSLLNAEQNGLKISARLLGVAQKIETRRP